MVTVRPALPAPLLFACLLSLVALACGSSTVASGPNDASMSADTGARRDAGQLQKLGGGDGSAGIVGPLAISPLNASVTVPYGAHAPNVTYKVTAGGHPVLASFSVDLGQIGAIGATTGVFAPSGQIGGTAHVTATFGGMTVSTTVNVRLQLIDNGGPPALDAGSGAGGTGGVGGSGPGGPVTPATKAVLQGTPIADTGLAWLYPYDGTVWPQGLLAPLLQWAPGAIGAYDAIYIHITENGFEYQGFFASPATPFVNHPILQTAWDTLSYSNQGEPVAVSLVFESGGKAYGPLTETWTIAQGSLTGTVYYNSYGTALAINYPGSNGYPDFGGATLAIKHGATSPVLVAGTAGITPTNSNCRVCHSVAAGGSTLITQHGDNYDQSSSYALTAANTETVMPPLTPPESAAVATFAFPAIFPDGTFLLSDTGPLTVIGAAATTSGLFSIPAGAAMASTGLPAGFSAATPAFSPDGKHIAFNEYGVDQVSLGALDFDPTTSTFSSPMTLHTPPAGTIDVFPAFLPTNNAVIFERQVASPAGFGATWQQNRGELWWVDLATQNAVPLATLNGLTGATSYLPNGGTNHASDQTLQYEPTVNPVASGGYAWVVFTSRRLYGNVATQDPFLSDPRNYDATLSVTTKKFWVAAIDLNAPAGTDPSHPAFYLPAQELYACNSRGYWVVDPCEPNGTSCLTGDQCCSGACVASEAGLACGALAQGCSALSNKCSSSTDCCNTSSGVECIDGFCAQPSPR